MYLNTEAHLWTDRVGLSTAELQRARLGGIALQAKVLFTGHAVSWEFKAPANDESVAILIPDATPKDMTIIVYNLDSIPVTAVMTGWDVEPGTWEFIEGIDNDGDDSADTITQKRTLEFERTKNIEFAFPPKKTTIIKLKLKKEGKPYWKRPDLGIGKDDVTISGNSIKVKVHSLGSVDAPASTVALVSKSGETLTTADFPALRAPLDYLPKTADITLTVPSGAETSGCSIILDPDDKITEITKHNNIVGIP